MIPSVNAQINDPKKYRAVRFNAPGLKPLPRLEPMTKRMVDRAANLHIEWTRKVFAILPGPPLATILQEAPKDFHDDEPKAFTCCSNDVPIVTKAFAPTEILGIDTAFASLLGSDVLNQINAASGVYSAELIAAYTKFLNESFPEIIRVANYKARKAWEAFNKTKPFPGAPLTGNEPFIQALKRNGLKLATDKVTLFFEPGLKEMIVNGIRDGQSNQQVKAAINRKYGTRAAWHWARLVRTEMTLAIGETALAEYAAHDVPYVKFSKSLAARPPGEICGVLAEADNGYGRGVYLRNEAPQPVRDTHPSCRCNLLPVYRVANVPVPLS